MQVALQRSCHSNVLFISSMNQPSFFHPGNSHTRHEKHWKTIGTDPKPPHHTPKTSPQRFDGLSPPQNLQELVPSHLSSDPSWCLLSVWYSGKTQCGQCGREFTMWWHLPHLPLHLQGICTTSSGSAPSLPEKRAAPCSMGKINSQLPANPKVIPGQYSLCSEINRNPLG